MNLCFNHIKLHNFGSYADSELSLNNLGFCLVAGKNNYISDKALSNGAGKSTIWSAICYAITGETIHGLTTNLKNINIEEDSCYVELDLNVNTNNYIITRYHKPKNDLIIYKNGLNISGKGIRESEKILADNLPDLTKDLISSTIIIGQGMPNKFSSFSPSGRKELLEKLTKSDFMIEDIRTRLINRQSDLTQTIRQYADSLLINKTNLDNILAKKSADEDELVNLNNQNFDDEINNCKEIINRLEQQSEILNKQIISDETTVEVLNNNILKLTNEKSADYKELDNSYNESTSKLQKQKYQLDSDIKALRTEIIKLKSISDICPTCGQKLPNITKPDTTQQEATLAIYQNNLSEILQRLSSAREKYNHYLNEIDNKFTVGLTDSQNKLKEVKSRIANYKANSIINTQELNTRKEELLRLNLAKNNLDSRLKTLKKSIDSSAVQILELQNLISTIEVAKIDADEHLAVVKKMDMLVKRDFRGYLLADIIKYIDAKAKEYCEIVFGTANLSVYLDGNALSISYNDKLFDNLSGGEKQKVDLILQFAIRDLLQTYLNYSANILVLDEIFDGLDRISIDRIIELITNKLKDVESIFIISHHADELNLPIDSTITVIKNIEGISEIR